MSTKLPTEIDRKIPYRYRFEAAFYIFLWCFAIGLAAGLLWVWVIWYGMGAGEKQSPIIPPTVPSWDRR